MNPIDTTSSAPLSTSTIAQLKERLSEALEVEAKVELLLQISHVCQEHNLKEAVRTAKRALQYARSVDDTPRIAHAHFKMAEALVRGGELQKGLTHYTQSYEQTVRFNKAKAHSIGISIALIHAKLGNYDKALDLYWKGLQSLEEDRVLPPGKVELGKIAVYTNVARLFRAKGDFVSAIEYVYKALKICRETKTPEMIGPLLVAGNICYFLKDFDRATSHFRQALELSREAGANAAAARCLLNLGRISLDVDDMSSALSYQRQASLCIKDLHAPDLHALAFLLLGKIHHHWRQYEDARDCYQRAVNLFTQIQEAQIYGEAFYGLCLIDREEGNLVAAVEGLHKLLDHTFDNGFESNQMDCHRELAKTYEIIGDHRKALSHFKQFHKLNERVAGLQAQRSIARVQLNDFFAEHQEIFSKTEKRLGILSEELKAQEKHLAAIALSLNGRTSASKNGSPPEESTPAQSNALTKGEETPWTIFEAQFERIHVNFKQQFLQLHPDITPAELRVCCLLRSGLSSKETASVLSISTGSIEVYRHRIRKKLKLNSKSNLVSYLSSL